MYVTKVTSTPALQLRKNQHRPNNKLQHIGFRGLGSRGLGLYGFSTSIYEGEYFLLRLC